MLPTLATRTTGDGSEEETPHSPLHKSARPDVQTRTASADSGLGRGLLSSSGAKAARRGSKRGDICLRTDDTGGETDGSDLLKRSTDSFYFRVTAKLSSSCDEGHPLMLLDFVVAIGAIALQVFAMWSVWFLLVIYGKWGDGKFIDEVGSQEAFPAGTPRPMDMEYMLTKGQKPFFYPPLLIFCIISILGEIKDELAESKIGFILLHMRWKDLLKGYVVPTSRPWVYVLRLVLASFVQIFRLSLLLYFLNTTIAVLGTSDGPFNIVLNSLALIFVLNLDNYITYDLPEENLFHLSSPETLQRHQALWEDTRKVLDRAMTRAATRSPWLLDAFNLTIIFLQAAIGLIVVWLSLKLQGKTMKGVFLEFDDDTWNDDDRSRDDILDDYERENYKSLTRLYNIFVLVMLVLLLLEHHVALAFCSKRPLSRHAMTFVIELFGVWLVRALVIRYVLGNLVLTGLDEKWPAMTPEHFVNTISI